MSQLTSLESRPHGRNMAREAYEVLNYNQQLVQFADSKAGTLIVINSLFVAATGATGGAPMPPAMETLRALTVVASAAAVVLCLMVVMTRPSDSGHARSDLVYFGDILKRPNAGHYAAEFLHTAEGVHVDDLLHRTYVVAGIAQRKFQAYGSAQTVTAVSGVLWLLVHLVQAFS